MTEAASPRRYFLLKIMQSYLELDMYSALTLHTKSTIAAGREELIKFDSLLKVCMTGHILRAYTPCFQSIYYVSNILDLRAELA